MRLLSILMLFIVIATPAQASEKLRVITTFTVIADMTQRVAGEGAIVESITKPGAEIHDYQPTPQDIVKAQNADLILNNGLNLERWFEKFLYDLQDVPSVTVSDGIEPLSIYEGPYTGKPNPHAWMSFTNAVIYIDNIQKALSKHDPKNAKLYAQNAERYKQEVHDLAAPLKALLGDPGLQAHWLVTSEGAFSYLARDLGMKELYLWPINAEQQGTPAQVKNVIDTIRKENIPVIFSESTISDHPAKQAAHETGILYGGVLYVDSLSDASGPVPTYMDLLRVTTERIAQGFEKAQK